MSMEHSPKGPEITSDCARRAGPWNMLDYKKLRYGCRLPLSDMMSAVQRFPAFRLDYNLC